MFTFLVGCTDGSEARPDGGTDNVALASISKTRDL